MESASNREIKLLRKLNRKKYRDREGLFVVEGERAVAQVLENGILKIESVFVKESFEGGDVNAKLKTIADEVFAEIADTENTQGILALCHKPDDAKPEDLSSEKGIILATDAIQDPGNMGTILRTAAWFGVKALIAGHGSVDIYHPKVVRSTAGATGSIPVIQGRLPEILPELERQGWESLLLDGGAGAQPLSKSTLPQKTLLVVGNEGNGLNDELLSSGRKKVKIEGEGRQKAVESLNAAIAVSIGLYTIYEKA